MKAILEFDLDEVSDINAHKRCVSATDAYIALHEITSLLRRYTKYMHTIDIGQEWELPEHVITLSKHESDLLLSICEKISEEIYDIIDNSNINLNDLE